MIRVLDSGFFTSIQDAGRKRFQQFGVPQSGVMDNYASSMANAIVGNTSECAVLELTMVGPKLMFECATAITVTGANMSPKINGVLISNFVLINVCRGDVLSFAASTIGFRSYLAVSGGFKTEIVMGSRSMYKNVTSNHCVNLGDILKINATKRPIVSHAYIKYDNTYINESEILMTRGPEFDFLNSAQLSVLFQKEFTISEKNNRMAYQIKELVVNQFKEIITSFVLPGTIQLTPSGQLIILMRDAQVTGGYPRVFQLTEPSINVISQKMTNHKIRFKLEDSFT